MSNLNIINKSAVLSKETIILIKRYCNRHRVNIDEQVIINIINIINEQCGINTCLTTDRNKLLLIIFKLKTISIRYNIFISLIATYFLNYYQENTTNDENTEIMRMFKSIPEFKLCENRKMIPPFWKIEDEDIANKNFLEGKVWGLIPNMNEEFDSMEWSHFLIIDDPSSETNVNLCDIIRIARIENGSLVYMIDKEILPIFYDSFTLFQYVDMCLKIRHYFNGYFINYEQFYLSYVSGVSDVLYLIKRISF